MKAAGTGHRMQSAVQDSSPGLLLTPQTPVILPSGSNNTSGVNEPRPRGLWLFCDTMSLD